MPLSTKPTAAPRVPIEGAEMIVPLACIASFFLLVFGFLAWFFITMNRSDERSQARQERMYKSPFLRKTARIMDASCFRPGTPGWKRWWNR